MMDTLHDVMRSINGERKGQQLAEPPAPRRDHLAVFREFLDHLDRASKKKARAKAARTKSKARRK
jgi:hypothetical protein